MKLYRTRWKAKRFRGSILLVKFWILTGLPADLTFRQRGQIHGWPLIILQADCNKMRIQSWTQNASSKNEDRVKRVCIRNGVHSIQKANPIILIYFLRRADKETLIENTANGSAVRFCTCEC